MEVEKFFWSIQYAVRNLVQGFEHSPWCELMTVTTRDEALVELRRRRTSREEKKELRKHLFRALLKKE